MHLGISTGGHYLSEDGGKTFKAANQGVGAGFAPDPYPEFGQCVHKIARHDDAPGRLYMQNHGGWAEWAGPGGPRPDIGVLRSDDHGQSWRSIAKGLPSDFGFPHRRASARPRHRLRGAARDVDAHLPGGAPAVWRSENGGDSWSSSRRGSRRRRATSPCCATRWTSTTEVAGAVLRHDHRPALDRPRRRRGVGVPVRLAPADPLREGRGGLSGSESGRHVQAAALTIHGRGGVNLVCIAVPLGMSNTASAAIDAPIRSARLG